MTKRIRWPAVVVLRIVLAAASGALFALSLPPHDCEWLGWVAFVPLFFALRNPKIRPDRQLHALGLGMICGLVSGVVQIGWDLQKPAMLPYAYLPYIWIALVIGVVAAVSSLVVRSPRGLVWVLAVATAGVAVEWLTTFSPLPVGVALCENRTTIIIQIADTFGIWGVSFLIWLTNASVAEALVARRWTRALTVSAALLVAAAIYGEVTLHRVLPEPVTVAAIQDFSGGDAGGFAPTVVDTMSTPEKEDLIRDAAKRGARLIVGTEEAWGSAFQPYDMSDSVSELARETNSELVVGFQQTNGTAKDYNSAALVSASGTTIGVHHKMRLFLGERQTIQAGDAAHAWDSPVAKVGLLICFDSCYTNATREAVGHGAQIIAMPNYDPPTPKAVLHNLHAALIPFRAVENRVAFIRADPTGLSQIIEPDGRVVAETPMYRAEALVAPVSPGDGRGTFFTRFGDWFAWLCAGATIVMICLGQTRRVSESMTNSRS